MGGVVHGAHLLMLFGLIGMSAASEEEEVKPTTYEVVSRLPVAYTGIKTSDGPAACTASAGDVGCVQQLKTALDMTQRSTHLPPVCAGPQASSETGCLRFPKGNSTIKATVDRYGLQQKNYDVRWLPHSEATGGMKLTESPFEVDNVFAVGDYNNDGHLDLLVGANTANKLYRNEGSGKLALIKHAGNEIQDSTGEVAMWCDFDSDGYLDALMKSGIHWNNAGTGDFTAEATHSFKGSSDPTIDNIDGPCGDIDGDGNVDIVILTDIYYSQGNARAFDHVSNALGTQSTGHWGKTESSLVDVDGDGFVDIVINKQDTSATGGWRLNLYLNTGSDGRTFSLIVGGTSAGTPYPFLTDGPGRPRFWWADFNGDGHYDLFTSRIPDTSTVTTGNRLYVNNGNGTYTELTSSSPMGNARCDNAAFGDIDNDGDLDLWTCFDSNNPAKLYRNKGDGTFEELFSNALTKQQSDLCVFADMDNDGDSDAFYASDEERAYVQNDGFGFGFGYGFVPITTRLPSLPDVCYKGDPSFSPNQGVPPKEALARICYSGGAYDTYAAAFGDVDGDGLIDLYVGNAVSDSDDGVRYHGAHDDLLRNNGDGTFTSIRASAMARSDSLDYSAPSDARHTKAVAFGDFDADGDLDLLIASSTGYRDASGSKVFINNELWQNEGDGTFTEVQGTSITNAVSGKGGVCAIWADVDNDGDLDAIVCEGKYTFDGFNVPPLTSNPTAVLHINTGSTFVRQTTTSFNSLVASAVAAGDYDNDGHLDLFLGGLEDNFAVHKGNGDGTFTAQTVADMNITKPTDGIMNQWQVSCIRPADYNNDGWLDFFVCNKGPYHMASGGEKNQLFTNNGHGSAFILLTGSPLTAESGVSTADASWGDFDGDGWLDLIVANALIGGWRNELFKSLGGKSFTTVTQDHTPVTAIYRASYVVLFGDIDNDGDADLFTGNAAYVERPHEDFPGEMVAGGVSQRGDANELYLFSSCTEGANAVGGGCYDCPPYASRIDAAAVTSVIDVCVECPAAMTGSRTGCILCPAGKTRNVGEYLCTSCKAGTFCNADTNGPANCPSGSYCPEESSQPVECPAGTYCPANATDTATCPPGFFCRIESGSPTACDPGEYCTEGSAEALECPAGFYCPARTSEPIECPIGSYCQAGSKQPRPCAKGSFGFETMKTEETCTDACDEGYVCSPGSTSATDTSIAPACEARYYFAEGACYLCPVGSTCPVGTTIEDLPVDRGYFRLDNRSTDLRLCPDSRKNNFTGCSGGRATSSDGGGPCAPGLYGTYCERCDPSKGEGHYYAKATDTNVARCAECGTEISGTIAAASAAAGVVILICMLVVFLQRKTPAPTKRKLSSLNQSFTPMNKLKIIMTFYQLSSKVPSVYEVALPQDVTDFLESASAWVTFGVQGVATTPLECMGLGGYRVRILFWMILPPVLLVLVMLGVVLQALLQKTQKKKAVVSTAPKAKKSDDDTHMNALDLSGSSDEKREATLVEKALPTILKLLFVLYPMVTKVAFDGFPCYWFSNGNGWLRADTSIQCATEEYGAVSTLAWIGVAVYPIGVWAFFALLLFKASSAILAGKETQLTRAISFLHKDYDATSFWWELMEMLRKFLLVGLFVTIDKGSILQISLALVVCATYMMVQLQAAPYKNQSDDYLAAASSFSLLMVFFCSILYKFDALTQDEEIQEQMTTEQKENYIVSATLLSVILVASVACSLVFAAALVFVQILVEIKNNAKLRRLKYTATGKWVECKTLTDPQAFHLFLSHAWPAAQDRMRIVKARFLEALPSCKTFLDVDDLKSGSGTAEVDKSECILVFCTSQYFEKKNSLKELYRAVVQRRPILAMLEPDATQEGGLNQASVEALITNKKLDKFKLRKKWAEWKDEGELLPAAFDHAPDEVEFQDVSIRLIAQNGILSGKSGELFLQGEAATGKVSLPPPVKGRSYHLFCSPFNAGAEQLAEELKGADVFITKGKKASAPLTYTSDVSKLVECDHMLVLLDARTWTSGEDTAQLVEHIHQAMRLGVHLNCVHEFPAVVGPHRHECEFGLMFGDDWTPPHLTGGPTNLYKEIALALKGIEWRQPGFVAFASKLAASAGPHKPIEVKVPSSYAPKAGPNKWKDEGMMRKIEAALRIFDADRDFIISPTELHVLMLKIEPGVTQNASQILYNELISKGFDANGDGSISVEEFAAYWVDKYPDTALALIEAGSSLAPSAEVAKTEPAPASAGDMLKGLFTPSARATAPAPDLVA